MNTTTEQRGISLFSVIVFLSIILLLSLSLISYAMFNRSTVQLKYLTAQSLNVAEAGIDKALWCLNNPTLCATPYLGETTDFGPGQFATTITTIGDGYIVESTGTVQGKQKKLKVTISQEQTESNASFFYGVQVGIGGVHLSQNAYIDGNVYANGSAIGENNSYITGDVILTPSNPTTDAVSSPDVSPLTTKNFGDASNTEYLAQSFVPTVTDKIYSIDLKIAKHNSPSTSVTLYIYTTSGDNPGTNISGGGQQITVTVPADSPAGWENGWTTQAFNPSTNPILLAGTKYWLILKVSNNNSSKYWVSARDSDNLSYSAGQSKLDGDLTAMPDTCVGGCDIAFQINMGGVAPTLDIPSVEGNGYSRIIKNTTVGQKAYYDSLSGTVKASGGTDTCSEDENGPNCYDNQSDQPVQDFPISSAIISQMEAAAESGGTESSDCTITDTESIGPKRYNCDITIDGTVTIAGTVWVNGNITLNENAILKLDSGYSTESGMIIADYISDPTIKGRLIMNNNTNICGTDCAIPNETYIMGISTYRDPLDTTSAIEVSNNLSGSIMYAPYGIISIANNASLKEVTAQKLVLKNNAYVIYESGLANVKFSNGPGGIWAIESDTWTEIN
ncbi:MAG: hypothetical protein PHY34_01475 [Patescibacteria group bacterium]|nr:hypothetical protein [Patescibacteria group bacterium]MDD5715109.1 hypothetical protein [Patescibacteria group bacterium]